MTADNESVLVFDNTKFAFANYAAGRDELIRLLEDRGSDVTVMTRSIRGGFGVGLGDLADELAALGHGTIILGFADAGVTPATTRLGLALQSRGIRAVVVAGDPGIGLARQVAAHQGPDLPIVHLPLRQWMTADEARSEAREAFPALIQALGAKGASTPPETMPTVPLDAGAEEVFEWMLSAGLTDGLPVIPPTERHVERFLDGRSPTDVLVADLAPSGGSLTTRHAVIAAVLAGCAPIHVPFVITALEAMAAPEFALWQAATSTNPSGTLIVASGPLAEEAGIHSGPGCLGPGFRANATIGRAVNLALLLAGGATPGVGNMATQGSPAQYTYCFAENRTQSPWPGLAADRFGPEATTVTVFHGEGPHNVVDMLSGDAQGILDGVASTSATLGSNNTYLTGELMVILCPDHAEIIARSGWTKLDVQQYLFETVRMPAGRIEGHGQVTVRPEWANELDPVPAILSPEAVTVVVAGGHGGHSSVVLPWAMNRSVTRPLSSPVVR